jgi:hypothetical protein
MKMKKNVLSAAVLAAIGVGSAQAVTMSQDGTGEVLYYPFYTVNGNNETLMSVVNTTDQIKAVKVRFREAKNSREVLDFALFLSPYDVWTAKVQSNGFGGAELITNDQSCTHPQNVSGTDFRTFAYDGSIVAFPVDGGGTSVSRLTEGYAEIIEMGWVEAGIGTPLDGAVHTPFGPPVSCQNVSNSINNLGQYLSAPSGGLFGSSGIINVAEGSEISVPLTVLGDVFDNPNYAAPGNEAPTVASATPTSVVMDVMADTTMVWNSSWAAGVLAVNAPMMAESVMNEYPVNPATEAETSWVVTFPTKGFHTDRAKAPFAIPPFENMFDGELFGGRGACDRIEVSIWDREENLFEPEGDDFSPQPDGEQFEICYEANVVDLGDSDVFTAINTRLDINTPFNNGWMRMSFPGDPLDAGVHRQVSNEGHTYYGLPVIGFRATKLGNSGVGIGATYAVGHEHKYDRVISGSAVIGIN